MSTTPTGIKRALLIGINYLSNNQARLYGCIEDVKNVQAMLIDAYGYSFRNIVVLRDDDPSKMPTKANILIALQAIVSASGPNDEIWFHYSGHGTQIRDTNGDESDGLDEAIVPVNYKTAGMIGDDDLYQLIRGIRCRAFLAFDSCHSGSVCDLQYSINYTKGTFAKSVSSQKWVSNSNIVVMSGCRDSQTSADSYDTDFREYGGAFTISLMDSLRRNNHTVDLMKLYNDVCFELISAKYDQIPVLSSSSPTPTYTFARPLITTGTSTSSSASMTVVKGKSVSFAPNVEDATRPPVVATSATPVAPLSVAFSLNTNPRRTSNQKMRFF